MDLKDHEARLAAARDYVKSAVKKGERALGETIAAVFYADSIRIELHIFSEGKTELSDLHAYTSNSSQFVKYMNAKGDFIPASTYQ